MSEQKLVKNTYAPNTVDLNSCQSPNVISRTGLSSIMSQSDSTLPVMLCINIVVLYLSTLPADIPFIFGKTSAISATVFLCSGFDPWQENGPVLLPHHEIWFDLISKTENVIFHG